jgi:hypothetical protein
VNRICVILHQQSSLCSLTFFQTQFEPDPTSEFGVIKFLAEFDAIFTPNQDTLLEQQYIPFANQKVFSQTHESPGYLGAYRPGVIPALDSSSYGASARKIELFKPTCRLALVPNFQPYFKLHGSIDIKQRDRDDADNWWQ